MHQVCIKYASSMPFWLALHLGQSSLRKVYAFVTLVTPDTGFRNGLKACVAKSRLAVTSPEQCYRYSLWCPISWLSFSFKLSALIKYQVCLPQSAKPLALALHPLRSARKKAMQCQALTQPLANAMHFLVLTIQISSLRMICQKMLCYI